MQNLADYLEWRGDLTFERDPFNEIDNLVCSVIVMTGFGGIVPAGYGETVTLAEAVRLSTERDTGHLGLLISDEIRDFPQKAARCARFRDIRLCGYADEIDETEHKQFAAMTFLLPDGFYTAFRGTDDTIVGWKEDMELSFLAPVPAQERAQAYLEEAAAVLPGKVRTGGHSKGGNLAVWAAAHAAPEVRERITHVYSNDGPGFLRGTLREEGFLDIADRTVTFMPQSSVVGALLDSTDDRQIIHSNAVGGVLQHDPMSWEVKGTRFVYLDEMTGTGKRTERVLDEWIGSMTLEERHRMCEALSDLADASDAKTLTELSENRLRALRAVTQAFRDQPQETKDMIHELIQRLLRTASFLPEQVDPFRNHTEQAEGSRSKGGTLTADEVLELLFGKRETGK